MVTVNSLWRLLPPPSPKRVLLIFLGILLLLQVAALVIGYIPVPGFTGTLWDGLMATGPAILSLAPVVADHVARHFMFLLGALGVLGLMNIYFDHKYHRNALQGLVGLLAMGLLLVYAVCIDVVLPFDASFFYRVSLFIGFSLLAFCVSSLAEYLTRDGTCAFIFLCMTVFMAIVTLSHGAGNASVPFMSYQLTNALLHLVLSLGGMAAWLVFDAEMEKQASAAGR